MYHGEVGYLNLLQDVLSHGERRSNRTGVDTMSMIGPQLSFLIDDTFPLITTKRVWWKGIAVELDWMLQGVTNVQYMQDLGVKIWDAWADERGELGPVYGVQWRAWQPPFDASGWMDGLYQVFAEEPQIAIDSIRILHERWKKMNGDEDAGGVIDGVRVPIEVEIDSLFPLALRGSSSAVDRLTILATHMGSDLCEPIDQIAAIVDKLRHHREDRRVILSAWNVGEIDQMKLPPCHYAAQFLVSNDNRLTCVVSIRSWDLFLGGPFNIGQYALLTSLLAHVSGLKPHRVVFNAGDAHIYVNHIDQVREQCERPVRAAPRLNLNQVDPDDIDAFRWDQASIEGYDPHPTLRGEIAV